MNLVDAYAAMKPKEPLRHFQFELRDLTATDVQIEVFYCGICHSDIHQVRDEWSPGIFPMVPGHEITGKVTKVGLAVNKFKVGDTVGVGCMINSCKDCSSCSENLEQYCEKGATLTYNDKFRDTGLPIYGGYAKHVVVNEDFVLRIPSNLPLDKAAPLLCAGITTYSPLSNWKVTKGNRVGVIGMGGLGHMAVKIAVAMGADVFVISHSENKKEDAKKFGAKGYINSTISEQMQKEMNTFDFIVNTVSANLDLTNFLFLLKRDGTMVQVGAPDKPNTLNMFSMIIKRRRLAGSLIGGIKETQEMLDFCGKHNITAEVEVISAEKINEAYERVVKSDVKYRFVIDLKSF